MSEPVFGLTRGAAKLVGEMAARHRQRLPDTGRRTRRVAPAGRTATSSAGPCVIRKMTLDGAQVWSLDLPSGNGGVASQVTELIHVNNTLLAMEVSSGLVPGCWIIDPDTGTVIRRISGSGSGASFPRMAADMDVIVTAVGNTSFDVHDHDGVLVWNNPTVNASHNRAIAINPDDDRIYCTGLSPSPGQDQNIYAYDVGNTTPQRTITFAVATNDIQFDTAGNLYAGLASNGSTEVRVWDSSGSLLWGFEHGGTVNAVAVSASGNVLIGGEPGTSSRTVRLLNSSGSEVWSANSGSGVLITGSATVMDVAIDENDNCYVTGNQSLYVDTNPATNTAGASSVGRITTTRKYNSSGTLQWSFDWGANTNAIVVDGSHLYMAGVRSTLSVHPVF